MGYGKNVVILTREAGYRKKPQNTRLLKLRYKKYPEFIKAMANRHAVYNATVDKIEQLAEQKEVLIIRPEKALEIGRLEKNPEKAQEIYDIGYQDGLKSIEKVKELLEG